MTGSAAAVLRVLARLAPARRLLSGAAVVDLKAAASSAVWLGYEGMWSVAPIEAGEPHVHRFTSLREGPLPLRATPELEQLAAIDLLHHEDRSLRAGWTVLTGRATMGGERVRVCTPLVSWPVRLTARTEGGFELVVAGDLETTALVTDRTVADVLAECAEFCRGGLSEDTDLTSLRRFSQWVRDTCVAADLAEPLIEPPAVNPVQRTSSVLTAVAGVALYTVRPPDTVSVREVLWSWSARPGIGQTALAELYRAVEAPALPALPADDVPVVSPLPLSAAQRAVVKAARTEPVTVVSGPPGCGKTHTLAALALDAVARGESVLLATRSRYPAEVIGGMLRRAAGPTPVLFGDTELRRAIAEELSDGLPGPAPRRELAARERALTDSVDNVRRLEQAAKAALADELAAQRARTNLGLAAAHRISAPRLFDGEVDPATVRRALGASRRRRRRLIARWRTERAVRRLRSLVDAELGVPVGDIEAALQAALDQRTATRLEVAGGTSLDALRTRLLAADLAARTAAARWMDSVTAAEDRRTRAARRAVGDLAAALRAGRATRRRLLAARGA